MLNAMDRRNGPYLGLAGLALVSACGFSIPGGSGTPDDGGSGSDGPADDSPPNICPWPYTPEYVTPCPAKSGPAIDPPTGKSVLDTDMGTLTGPAPASTPIPIQSEVVADVRIVWTSGLHIATGARLRVIGSLPVVFVSLGAITIDGELDGAGRASSPLVGDNPAGANPSECNTNGAGVGQPCAGEGASGGGGGSFGEMGGQGGGGGDGKNCGANLTGPVPGGSGGAALSMRPANLRGGCPGAFGGQSTAGGAMAGRAGAGGAGVALVARDAITISGVINVGGGGGGGGSERSGGGGGGSGGMIVLEGSVVSVIGMGKVAANGGGGGGGCDGNTGDPGEDALNGGTPAGGGPKEGAGTSGGDGGARGDAPQPADTSTRGGGGGGGGVGFVRIHAISASADPAAISPSPSP